MKRHTMWRAVCLLVCLLLVVTTESFALSVDEDTIVDGSIITEPYEYPVVPGMDEWKGFTTHEQMIQACRVPESILKRMTTEALLLTVMDFPLLGDTLLFDNEDAGYKALKENCNALSEFLERDDAETVFNNFHSQDAAICSYSDGYLKTIANICFELIYSKEFAQPANMHATFPTKVRNGNVKTPNGTQVYHYENLTFANHGYTESYIKEADEYTTNAYPAATRISGPNAAYNCHSYAWHSTSTGNNDWIDGDDSKVYWTDGSYKTTTSPVNADKVVYKSGSKINHSAIYYNAPTLTVYSKWSYLGVYKHTRSYCPFADSNTTYTSYHKS